MLPEYGVDDLLKFDHYIVGARLCGALLSVNQSLQVRVGLCQRCPLSVVLIRIFMDRISRHSQVAEGVNFGILLIPSLLFADDAVLLVSS